MRSDRSGVGRRLPRGVKLPCNQGNLSWGVPREFVSSWLLLIVLFLVWRLWGIAAAVQRAVADVRRGTEVPRGGVSVFPVIPLFPLAFWGVAILVDRAAAPWGTWTVGLAHGGFAVCLVISIVRDYRRLHS